jgi:curved DNA-binding protein CbpA
MGSRAVGLDAASVRGGALTQLSVSRIGAQQLAIYARDRKSGVVRWSVQGKSYALELAGGRPVRAVGASGQVNDDPAAVARTLRAFATADQGELVLEERQVSGVSEIDTLGEILVELCRSLSPAHVTAIAGSAPEVVAEPSLARLNGAIAQMCGSPPMSAMANDKATVIAFVLGSLKPRPNPLIEEIVRAHAAMADQDHYQFLGIDANATPEVIRKAYFEHAKRWHSDRFAGVDLGEHRATADALFRRADEAQKVLSDPQQKADYDAVRERTAAGLPTDVNVVMEAEGLFRKAKMFVLRGQAAAAEPLLAQAIAMNKGEAEFFVYHGYALFAANGADAIAEARKQISKGLEMNPKLDSAHELLGKIARVEGNFPLAIKHLKQAIAMNPKNSEAERELRFIQTRQQKEKTAPAGLFGGLLKKKS